MDKYLAMTDDFEIRSSLKDKIKRYYARGFASFKGLDAAGTKLNSKAMEKVKRDLLARDVRVGTQHSNVLGDKIIQNLLQLKEKYSLEGKDVSLIDNAIYYASKKQLPLGKTRIAEVTKDGVQVEVEINPYLRELNPNYYDAVINMLEDKFLDGFSIEFANAKTHDELDESGSRFKVISDLDVMGLEFVSGAANPNARITEVFCRMAGVKDMEEKKMEDVVSKEEYDKIKVQLEEADNKLKSAEEELKKMKPEDKKEDEKLIVEGDKKLKNEELDSLKEELSELKELIKSMKDDKKLSGAKGIVSPEDKYGDRKNDVNDEKDVEKIRAEIEKKSLSELMKEVYK